MVMGIEDIVNSRLKDREADGVFDHYKVIGVLGCGGFSEVRKVSRGRRIYAMKVPKTSASAVGTTTDMTLPPGSEDEYERYYDEARRWARLSDHIPDSVVRLVDFNIDPFPWMVMEMAEIDMEKAIRQNKATVDDVIQLLHSLQRIHDMGVVHRDIKPGNILLVDGVWKFSDFGLSRSIKSVSLSGSVKGTPEYMAPEQFMPKEKGPADERTDIWQMGILAYRIIVGKSPYMSSNLTELMGEICKEGPDTDAIPEQYRDVLSVALSMERQDRYGSAEDFAIALEACRASPTSCTGNELRCSRCGHKLTSEPDIMFCPKCGAKLEKASSIPPTTDSKPSSDPPMSPADACGKINGQTFTIKFVPPADSNGVTYCIYRERNSLPILNNESRPLAEVPTNQYTDSTMEPGIEYYYSIYSKRKGILSKEGTHLGPVMMIAEVDNVTIDPIEGGLRIKYEKPQGASRVRLWRSDGIGSTSTEIALNGQTIYDDIGLEGGKKYYYLFVAEYEGRNKVERSPGVVYSETTVDPPKPVRDLKIKWNKSEGAFTAKWSSTENVLLYSSPRKITTSGPYVYIKDVESRMTRIIPLEEYSDGMKFTLPDGAIQYIYPIIPRNSVGIIGRESIVANLRPFTNINASLHGSDIFLTMDWPDETVEAKIVVSENCPGQDAAVRSVLISRSEYEDNGKIVLSIDRDRHTILHIYANYMLGSEKHSSKASVIEYEPGEEYDSIACLKNDVETS